jgi:Phage integrase family
MASRISAPSGGDAEAGLGRFAGRRELGLAGLVRRGLRHTALTWMSDSGVPLYVLQRVAGHQDPAVTARHLHPDTAGLTHSGSAFSAWWGLGGGRAAAADSETDQSLHKQTGA